MPHINLDDLDLVEFWDDFTAKLNVDNSKCFTSSWWFAFCSKRGINGYDKVNKLYDIYANLGLTRHIKLDTFEIIDEH